MRGIRAGLSAGLLLAGASAAHADDARLRVEPYPGNRVLRIAGRTGVQAVIAFGEDEHIENVAIGDANAWQVTPNRRANMLFVKPLQAHAVTNLTVVTDRHSYFFDLAAAPGSHALYALTFTYPAATKPQKPAIAPGLTAEEAGLAQAAPQALPTDLAALDFGWKTKGKPALLPARVFADGRNTYLSWPARASLPAVLGVDDKGNESPLNFAVRDDMIVIEGVPARIVLRAGRDLATIDHVGEHAGVHGREPVAPLAAVTPGEVQRP